MCWLRVKHFIAKHSTTRHLLPKTAICVCLCCLQQYKLNSNILYLYHDGTDQKGSNKVCTFLLRYVNDYVPSTIDGLYLYNDNCRGQCNDNKNNAMIRFTMAVTDSGRFKKVFFQSGDTRIYPMIEILAW